MSERESRPFRGLDEAGDLKVKGTPTNPDLKGASWESGLVSEFGGIQEAKKIVNTKRQENVPISDPFGAKKG